jgi:hypothetical protein
MDRPAPADSAPNCRRDRPPGPARYFRASLSVLSSHVIASALVLRLPEEIVPKG